VLYVKYALPQILHVEHFSWPLLPRSYQG